MQNKITPFLWFEQDLKEVVIYYKNIFNRDDKVCFEEVSYNLVSEAPHKVEVSTVKFFGNSYYFMSANRRVSFNESVSLMVQTEDQEETDYYWDAFTKEGKEIECGWCIDKYGLSWQITPRRLMELNTSEDKDVASYAIEQMMTMKKIIIKDLERI